MREKIRGLIEEEKFRCVFLNIQWISSLLGVTLNSLDEQTMMLFIEIEKRKEKVREERLKSKAKKIDRGRGL